MDLGNGSVAAVHLRGLSKTGDIFLIRFPNLPPPLVGVRTWVLTVALSSTALCSTRIPRSKESSPQTHSLPVPCCALPLPSAPGSLVLGDRKTQ